MKPYKLTVLRERKRVSRQSEQLERAQRARWFLCVCACKSRKKRERERETNMAEWDMVVVLKPQMTRHTVHNAKAA